MLVVAKYNIIMVVPPPAPKESNPIIRTTLDWLQSKDYYCYRSTLYSTRPRDSKPSMDVIINDD